MRNIWRKIKKFLGHHLILELALIGAFAAFVVNPGSLGDFMRICGAIFLFNVLIGNYHVGDATAAHLVLLGIFLMLLLINGFMPHQMIHERSFRYFLAVPGMIFAIHSLSKSINWDSSRMQIYCGLAVLSVLMQLIAYYTIESVNESIGLYSNVHHFGAFASLILPVLIYFSIRINGWPRTLALAAALVAFFLLWKSSSRISWLSFFSSVLAAIFIFLRRRKLLLGLGSVVVGSFLAAYVAGFAAIKSRIADILINWRTEERITVWADTIRMLKDNSAKDWLLGHGIGSFRYYFVHYNTFKMDGQVVGWNFPHNFFFQVIFENGLVGLLIILAGIVLLMLGLWRAYNRLQDTYDRYLVITIFILFWINFIHGALTLSFYQKYFVYPLSVICGFALVLLEKSDWSHPIRESNWYQGAVRFLAGKIPLWHRRRPKPKTQF